MGRHPVWAGACQGQRVVLAQSGVGQAKAEVAARFLLDHYPLSALLSVGFGGGLSRELAAGDVVVCPSVHCAGEGAPAQAIHADAELVARAIQALGEAEPGVRGDICLGNGLTMDRVVADPDGKSRLGQTLPVKVVDMESFWVARQAQQSRIPFLAVRAISDPVDQPLPAIVGRLNAGERASTGRMMLALLRQPAQLPALWKLTQNVRLAAKNLEIFVVAFLRCAGVEG